MEISLALPTGRGRGVLSRLLLEDGHKMIVAPVGVYKIRHVQYYSNIIICLMLDKVTSTKKEHKVKCGPKFLAAALSKGTPHWVGLCGTK
jgi:hypothetical protein